MFYLLNNLQYVCGKGLGGGMGFTMGFTGIRAHAMESQV
jgi:hypothetical protein